MNSKDKPKHRTRPWTYHPLLILTALGLLIVACIDTIDLEIPKGTEDALVINAKIVKASPSIFTLKLSRLFNYTTGSRARIIAKNVYLYDGVGNRIEIRPSGDGIYYYEFRETDPVKIEIGGSYKVEVETLDGQVFVSGEEPLLPVPRIKEIRYDTFVKAVILSDQRVINEPYIQYSIDTDLVLPELSAKNKLKWEIYRTYKVTDAPLPSSPITDPKICYVSNLADLYNIMIYDGELTTITGLENHIVHEEKVSGAYGEGMYYTIVQESLSSTAFQYWETVKNLLARKDNIYADPPGKEESNFTQTNGDEEVFGFFYATEQDTARIYIDPELIGSPSIRCPPPTRVHPDGSCADKLCCDCLSEKNSQLTKPSFWIN